MAKKFACKDIGMEQCSFEVASADEAELMDYIRMHAKRAHNMENIDDAMSAKIKGAIKDVQ